MESETGFLLHLADRRIQRSLSIPDPTCHEIVEICVLTGNECAGSKLVGEHDLITPGVMSKHRDSIAALHHFPRESLESSVVPLHFELIPIYAQKSLV
jgi:hypothetical protein